MSLHSSTLDLILILLKHQVHVSFMPLGEVRTNFALLFYALCTWTDAVCLDRNTDKTLYGGACLVSNSYPCHQCCMSCKTQTTPVDSVSIFLHLSDYSVSPAYRQAHSLGTRYSQSTKGHSVTIGNKANQARRT